MRKNQLFVGTALLFALMVTGCGNVSATGSATTGTASADTVALGDMASYVAEDSMSEKPGTDEAGKGGQQPGGAPGETGKGGQQPGGTQGGNGGGQPGGSTSSAPASYTAATEYTGDTTTSGENYSSTGTDENAVLVDGGANVTLENATRFERTSSESKGGDSSSFYGVGAAALVTDGTMTIHGGTITTDAGGGAGVFAYNKGIAYVDNTTISTNKGTSGGIHVAGGGTLYATNLTVNTNGASSAAIRSDRGGGTMVVDGGSYTSNGSGSPAIYSTADITVSNADLTATGSEAICIEGFNRILLSNCNLSGNMAANAQNDCVWNVILYQSMSGDSKVGNSTFSMTGGTLTAGNGGMFYTTNTESTFYLSGVTIKNSSSNDFLLKCTGNSNTRGWGKSGANGADCSFTADAQTMSRRVVWDSISQLNMVLQNGSVWTGAAVQDETNAGNGGNGTASVTVDATSQWIVTGNSVLTSLIQQGSIVDEQGNTVTIQGTDGTVYVSGNSSNTITVSNYSR